MKDFKILTTKQITNGDTADQIYLDLLPNESISFSYELLDLQDLRYINTFYTFNFRLPNTKNNSIIFDFVDLKTIDFNFNPYHKLYCKVLLDDAIIFNGYLILNKIVYINEIEFQYEVTMYDILNDVLKTINNEKLIGNTQSILDVKLDNNIKGSTYSGGINVQQYKRLQDSDDTYVIPNMVASRILYDSSLNNYDIRNYKYCPSVSMTEVFFNILESKGLRISNKDFYFINNDVTTNSDINTDMISKFEYSDVLSKQYYLDLLEPVVSDNIPVNRRLNEAIDYHFLGNTGSITNLNQFYPIIQTQISASNSTKDYLILNNDLATISNVLDVFFTNENTTIFSTVSQSIYYNNRNKFITDGRLQYENNKTKINGITYSYIVDNNTYSYINFTKNIGQRDNNYYKRNILVEKNGKFSYNSCITNYDGRWTNYDGTFNLGGGDRPYTYLIQTINPNSIIYDPNGFTQVLRNTSSNMYMLGAENKIGFDSCVINFDNEQTELLNKKSEIGYLWNTSYEDWNNLGETRDRNMCSIKADSKTKGWYQLTGSLPMRLEYFNQVEDKVAWTGSYSYYIDILIEKESNNVQTVQTNGIYNQLFTEGSEDTFDRYQKVGRLKYEFNSNYVLEMGLSFSSYQEAYDNATSSGILTWVKNTLYVFPTVVKDITSDIFYLDEGDKVFLCYKNWAEVFRSPYVDNDKYGIFFQGSYLGEDINERLSESNIGNYLYPIVENGAWLNMVSANPHCIQTVEDGQYLFRGTMSFDGSLIPNDSYLVITKTDYGNNKLGYNDYYNGTFSGTVSDSKTILYREAMTYSKSTYTFSCLFESNQDDILNNNITIGVQTRGDWTFPYFYTTNSFGYGINYLDVASGSSYELFHYNKNVDLKYPNIVKDRSFYLNDEDTKLKFILQYLKIHNLYLLPDKLNPSLYQLKTYNQLYDEITIQEKIFEYDNESMQLELNTEYIKKEFNFNFRGDDDPYYKIYFKLTNKPDKINFNKQIICDNTSTENQDMNFDFDPVIFYLNSDKHLVQNIGYILNDNYIYTTATQSINKLFDTNTSNIYGISNAIYYNSNTIVNKLGGQINYNITNNLSPDIFITNNLDYIRLQNKRTHVFNNNLKYYNNELSNNNLYTEWARTIEQITNPRVINVKIKMSNLEFINLELNNIIVLNVNGFFKKYNILKIFDYNPFEESDLINMLLLEI